MARKRFISSNMSVDEDIGEIAQENPTAALMWPWLLTAFDDWGWMEITSAIKIKLEVFPAFPFKSSEIEEALLLYVNYGLAYSYMVGNKKYLAIEPCKFYKYQTYLKEKNRLEDKSKCPAPIDPPWKDCPDCRDYSRTSADDRGLRTEIVLPPPPSLSLSLTPTDNKIPPPPNPPPEEKPVEAEACNKTR